MGEAACSKRRELFNSMARRRASEPTHMGDDMRHTLIIVYDDQHGSPRVCKPPRSMSRH